MVGEGGTVATVVVGEEYGCKSVTLVFHTMEQKPSVKVTVRVGVSKQWGVQWGVQWGPSV